MGRWLEGLAQADRVENARSLEPLYPKGCVMLFAECLRYSRERPGSCAGIHGGARWYGLKTEETETFGALQILRQAKGDGSCIGDKELLPIGRSFLLNLHYFAACESMAEDCVEALIGLGNNAMFQPLHRDWNVDAVPIRRYGLCWTLAEGWKAWVPGGEPQAA